MKRNTSAKDGLFNAKNFRASFKSPNSSNQARSRSLFQILQSWHHFLDHEVRCRDSQEKERSRTYRTWSIKAQIVFLCQGLLIPNAHVSYRESSIWPGKVRFCQTWFSTEATNHHTGLSHQEIRNTQSLTTNRTQTKVGHLLPTTRIEPAQSTPYPHWTAITPTKSSPLTIPFHDWPHRISFSQERQLLRTMKLPTEARPLEHQISLPWSQLISDHNHQKHDCCLLVIFKTQSQYPWCSAAPRSSKQQPHTGTCSRR